MDPFTWDWQMRKTATYILSCQLQFCASINVHPSKSILTLQLWNRDKHKQLGLKDDHTSLRNSIRNFNRRKFSSGNSLRRMYHTTLSFSVGSGIAKHTQKKYKNWEEKEHDIEHYSSHYCSAKCQMSWWYWISLHCHTV